MTPSEKAIQIERRVKLLFFSVAFILLFAVITQTQNMMISFLLAITNYYLLAPIVDFAERKGISRLWSTIIPFLILSIVIAVCIYLFTSDLVLQIKSLQQNFPKYTESMIKISQDFQNKFGDLITTVYPMDFQTNIQSQLSDWATAFLKQVPDFISKSFTVLLLAPLLTFFMLLDGRDFIRKFISLIPNQFFELALNLNYQIGSQIGGFIRARMLESIIVGALTWMGLLIMGFPYALVLSIFAAILNIIPYLGPIIGALPAFVICLSNGGSSSELLGLTVIFVAVQVIDTVVLVPFLVAKIVDLHPITVIVAILLGSQLMGILGMIICIPLVSTLKVTAYAIYNHFTDFRS